ncbi:Protein SERAC1, partial [Madurella mycetomatis]
MDPTAAAYLVIFMLSIAFLYYQVTKRIPSRLNSDQAPKSRFELVPACANGLPTRTDGLDIIFIHGLGSNPDTTWRATKNAMKNATKNTTKHVTAADIPEEAATDSERFVNWVSDFLPADILAATSRDVRIFFYNYDSYWKRDAVQTRLTNLGNELLEHINGGIRMSETERSRSLIFVAYSFGGLVVKRALVQARASRDFGHIVDYTKAILFLGAPHRGTSFGPWGWLAAQALQPLGSNPLLLANLEYDSISLHDLHKDFIAVAPDDLRVFNFFEKRPTQILRLWFVQWQRFCVREQSATYESRNVRNIGLSVDHSGLNKFTSKNESYMTILSKLIEVTESCTRSVKHHYAVPLETVRTYTERAELSTELEQKLRIRHEKASVPYAVTLHGLGGAGKSQLALDYAEKHKDQYNPILWIDVTDEEAVRSSFKTCATELGLPVERGENQVSVFTDAGVQAVLRWLRDRTETDEEWLVIVDNADDVSWGFQKVIPRGNRGTVIITSRDERSVMLVPGGCESVCVGLMSPPEGTALLLQHLRLDEESASEGIKRGCYEVANRLEYLALAIDLAGAYISSDSPSEQALLRYLADYDRHRDELLQMDGFRGLRPTEKTVWTVWDTTLEKIAKENERLRPDMLLTFLAHFKGSIVQDELFRLASLGTEEVEAELGKEASKGMPAELRQFLPLFRGEWDSFQYRQGRDLLLRYNLLQRVGEPWAGVTMHSLVQWRARQSYQSQPWLWWYTVFILAACYRSIEEEQPEFRRHLVGHLPDMSEDYGERGKDLLRHQNFIGAILGRIYYDEGRWEEAEKLFVQVMETSKTKLGADHPDTLTSMGNLASTLWNQGRWEEAEKLEVQ